MRSLLWVVCLLSFNFVACKGKGDGGGDKGAAPVASASGSASTDGATYAIDVGEHGFTPSSVTLQKGKPATLVFTRTSNSTCAFDVVFPELDIKRELPLKKAVAVVIPTDKDRTLTFQCGMGMYKSKVVVQ